MNYRKEMLLIHLVHLDPINIYSDRKPDVKLPLRIKDLSYTQYTQLKIINTQIIEIVRKILLTIQNRTNDFTDTKLLKV